MPDVVAFDSKDFERGVLRPFYTPVGASIRIKNIASMKADYESALSSIKNQIDMKRSTHCIRYYDFAKHLGREAAREPILKLLEAISGSIAGIDYYYVLTRLSEVRIYGKGLQDEVTREQFMELLSPYFVQCCAWKYLESNLGTGSESLLLDNFNCDFTGGTSLVLSAKPSIYVRGDECNTAISVADLAAAFFDLEFDRRNWRMDETDPAELFPNSSFKVRFNPITTRDFHAITPLERKKVPVHQYVKHPIVFFINESRPDELKEVATKDIFDRFLYRNPVWHETLNLAFEIDGSAKLLEPREDLELVEDKDILIYTGKSGKQLADYFCGHCPNARMMKAKELFDETTRKEIRETKI